MKYLDNIETKINQINGIRHYNIDNHNYPSVTSVIEHGKSAGFDPFKDWEEKLIKKHGYKIGMRKRDLPTKIGDFSHLTIENYLKGGDRSVIERTLAGYSLPFLDTIDEVLAVELTLYSLRGYAGRADAVVRLKDGRIAIIDHKTSSKKLVPSNTKNYWLQLSAYSLALFEQYDVTVDVMVINAIYKSMQGKRKPVRASVLEETEIRPHLNKFLECLWRFQQKEEELDLTQAF